ncbi:MAG: dTDP-4-dehydrorhamnose 3,5-epimerase [Chloroflexaceae bacterium]|nr:dTDP-4-dehydrorhamnose 3,5-epimerase [Chloroflexaceae bacterium]NJO07166.1 dTDP-4-dehydrorhamnose 3,5-epimerase [Chloroflexaceae bacterium]
MESHAVLTALEGVLIIETDFFRDERGFFIENYHKRRFAAHTIGCEFVQDNHSRSRYGVLRGFHYQDTSAPMAKLVRCTRGSVLDVVVDLRVGAPTFGRWVAVELTEDNMKQLMVPPWCGHAFLTLSDVADVQYKCSNYYTPSAEGNLAWNDPDIGVAWPLQAPILSQRDRQASTLREYMQRPAFVYAGAALASEVHL